MAENISSPLQTLKSHTSDVTCCDFGKNFTFASGSSDKTVRAWEWNRGFGYEELPFSPVGSHTYGVTDARFSPQGTMLATSSIDGSTVLWNIRTGCRLHTFIQPNGNAVRVCRFTPDSTQLATAGDDGTICIWNLAYRSLVRTIKGHEETVQALTTSPDSFLVASGCSQGLLNIWDLDGNQKASQDAAHDLGVTGADFCPIPQSVANGAKSNFLLATCGHDHLVRLWNVSSGKLRVVLEPLSKLSGHSSTVLCVRFCSSGTIFASGSMDKTVRVWETSGKCIQILDGHTRYIASCAFSRDGSIIATGSNDKTIKIWDLAGRLSLDSELVPHTRNTLEKVANSSSEAHMMKQVEDEQTVSDVKLLQRLDCGSAVNGCSFSPTSLTTLLAAGTGDKLLKVWRNQNGRFVEMPYSPIEAHRYSVNQVEWSSDATLVCSCSLDGTAALWQTESGQRSHISLQSSGAGVRTCRFSPDGCWVVTGSDDEKAVLRSLPSGAVHGVLCEHTEAISGAAFSPDSRVLATCDLMGTIRLWDIDSLHCLVAIKSAHDLGTQSCDFSPSESANKCGRYLLASGGNDSMVRLWRLDVTEIKPGQNQAAQLKCLTAHGGNITCVRFAPNGQLLASAASDKTARVWNVLQGDCLFVLETHSSIVTCCSFSSDGSLMATGSLDKSVIVWQLPKAITIRSLAEERLKQQKRKLEDWTSKDVGRWLSWLDIPEVPPTRYFTLTGADLLQFTALDLAQHLGFEGDMVVSELTCQLFWLRREQDETLVRPEDLLTGGVPHELLCPITQELLREPVLCAAIDEWFLGGKLSSPMTNLPLPEACYVPNIQLRKQICSLLFGDP
ncbi:hypothetical protein B566_EDAN008383 [Ephemera danica]|nr:hypothetical protein B566_EDAN008383 [Ephemera danica]